MSMLPFSSSNEGQEINEQLLREYAFFLANKAKGTIEAYLRTVRQIMIWIAGRPGNGGRFQPQHFTKTAVEMYLASLEREGFSQEVSLFTTNAFSLRQKPMRMPSRRSVLVGVGERLRSHFDSNERKQVKSYFTCAILERLLPVDTAALRCTNAFLCWKARAIHVMRVSLRASTRQANATH